MLNIDQVKEEIKSRVSLVELSGAYCKRSECPFPDCPGAAFFKRDCVISDDSFFCFRCKRRGDLIYWMMVTQGLNYIGAIRALSESLGIPLSPNKDRTKLLEKAVAHFSNYLRKVRPEKLDYLINRGIPANLIYRYQIGYIDYEGEALESLELTKENLYSLGLLYPPKTPAGSSTSALAGRYIFPIRDNSGHVVQLKGRADPAVLSGEAQKSLPLLKRPMHAPESWGSVSHMNYLYLEEELTQGDELFICEGEPDTLTMRSLGFRAVGIQTNTGIAKHAAKLREYKNIYLLLDNDEASNRVKLNELYELQLRLPKSIIYNIEIPALAGENVKVDVNDYVAKYKKTRKDLVTLIDGAQSADSLIAKVWGPMLAEKDMMSKLSLLVRSSNGERKTALIKAISEATGRSTDLIGFALDPANH